MTDHRINMSFFKVPAKSGKAEYAVTRLEVIHAMAEEVDKTGIPYPVVPKSDRESWVTYKPSIKYVTPDIWDKYHLQKIIHLYNVNTKTCPDLGIMHPEVFYYIKSEYLANYEQISDLDDLTYLHGAKVISTPNLPENTIILMPEPYLTYTKNLY